MLNIRNAQPGDHAAWDVLYQGYAGFYKTVQTPAMRDTVWGWIMDPSHETEALVALDPEGTLVGLAHFRAFARPLSATVGGFLDDLFVAPAARGQQVADALLSALSDEGQRRGWSVIRWITAEDNYRARTVYDRLADRTKWLTYDIKL